MVKRVILGRSGEEQIVDLIKQLGEQSTSGDTRPAGNKVLDDDEDFYWGRLDGSSTSMRAVDEGLTDAQNRIDEAEGSLAQSQIRLDDAEEAVSQTQQNLDRVETEVIPGAVADLEAADQAAQQELGELDSRLTSIDAVGTGELASIRDALTAAQDAVDAAQQVANEANTAANAASQAALEAAGIAESKGRVIVSETEPTGEDRTAANIWIKPVPDNPDTEVEEKAVTYVYLEATDEWQPTTSSELAQAAQNALDAREAAQQAQQRADTAIANAATAQAAAEAAQQTADQATLDARGAHNEAVAAQEAADSALASATNLIPAGGFESGDLMDTIAGGGSGANIWEVITDPDGAHQGRRYMRMTGPTDAPSTWGYTVSEPEVVGGRTYRFTMAARIVSGSAGGSNGGMAPLWYASDGSSINRSVEYPQGLWRTDGMIGNLTSEWQVFTGDVVAPADAVKIRPRLYFNGGAIAPGSVIDIDAITLQDVTDALAAQAAAEDAQARADEAYDEAAKKLDESQVDAKITASANGKNSITISTGAPSGDGVATGDVWWRRDGDYNIFGQWVWTGSAWGARQIRSEVIANLDVHKLTGTSGEFADFFAENFTANDAVVEQLWADQLVGKTAAFNRLTVAPGNLFPDPYFRQEDMWSQSISDQPEAPNGTALVLNYSTSQVGSYYGQQDYRGLTFEPGASYRVRFMGRFGGSPAPVTVRFYVRGENAAGDLSIAFSKITRTAGYSWVWHEGVVDIPDDFRGPGTVGFFSDISEGGGGQVLIGGVELTKRVGAVLIEDGAITTPKLTVTGDMSAAIVNAMSVNTKRLVVTEDTILNHATLIGQTVVDDINVQGKLIGTDGVFTGTVDFANINVTGSVLADTISGNTIEGATLLGSELETSEEDGHSVYIAGDAVPWEGALSPGVIGYAPGVRFTGTNQSGQIGYISATPGFISPSNQIESLRMGVGTTAADGAIDTGAKVEVTANGAYLGGYDAQVTVDTGQYANVRLSVTDAGMPSFQANASTTRVRGGNADVYLDGSAYVRYDPSVGFAHIGPNDGQNGYRITAYDDYAILGPSGRSGYLMSAGDTGLEAYPSDAAGWGIRLDATRAVLEYWDASGTSNSDDDIDLLKAVIVGDWADLVLGSSWSPRTSGGYFPGIRVRKMGNSMEINGAVQGGSPGSTIAVLPSGLRPARSTFVISTLASGGLGQAFVGSNGDIVHSYGANSPGFLAINVTIPLD